MTKVFIVTGVRQTGKTRKSIELIGKASMSEKILYINSHINNEETLFDFKQSKDLSNLANLIIDFKIPSKKILQYFDMIVIDIDRSELELLNLNKIFNNLDDFNVEIIDMLSVKLEISDYSIFFQIKKEKTGLTI